MHSIIVDFLHRCTRCRDELKLDDAATPESLQLDSKYHRVFVVSTVPTEALHSLGGSPLTDTDVEMDTVPGTSHALLVFSLATVPRPCLEVFQGVCAYHSL